MKSYEDEVLRLAKEANGDWVTLPRTPEYAQAAINLQGLGKVEMDGFGGAGVIVRLH